MKLNTDKDGNIYLKNGKLLGSPKKTGGVYRSGGRKARIDLDNGNVYDKKERLLGTVNLSVFEVLVDVLAKRATQKAKAAIKASKKTKAMQIDAPAQKEESIYRPGLDSSLIVSGRLGKELYKNRKAVSNEDVALSTACAFLKKKYKGWGEISVLPGLSDKFLATYEPYIDWFLFLSNNPDREFEGKYHKLFAPHLILRTLRLVPYSGQCDIKKYRPDVSARKSLEKEREAKERARIKREQAQERQRRKKQKNNKESYEQHI